MRLATWNCKMAYRRKAARLKSFNWDLLVVPECEDLNDLKFAGNACLSGDFIWRGSRCKQGLGVFAANGIRLTLDPRHTDDFQIVLPVIAERDNLRMNLLAVWANNPSDRDGRYVTQVWKAIARYRDFLLENPLTVIMGDFNSNTIWDRPRRIGNHSDVVECLRGYGMESAYHSLYGCNHGEEMDATFYLCHKQTRPYHIDYCFLSSALLEDMRSATVGDYAEWIDASDHMPLVVDCG